MFLRILVLITAILQIPAAALLSVGTFENVTRPLPTLIQPAGWAFSIWGLIYLLSLVFAIYQVIPKNDNQTLRAVRIPALIAFAGSTLWLWLAGDSTIVVWGTVPVLFIMAGALSYVVSQPRLPARWPQLFSQSTLLPYAAWTGIAQWLNVQALLNDREVITTESINLISNLGFLVCIALFSFYFFYRSGWSVWYGGVIAWASLGIVVANMPSGSYFVAIFAGLLGLSALACIRRL